jgi:hypothetical protein
VTPPTIDQPDGVTAARAARRPSPLMLEILRLATTTERGVFVRDIVAVCARHPESISRSLRRLADRGAIQLHQRYRPLRVRSDRRFYTSRVTTTLLGRELLAVNSFPRAGAELTDDDAGGDIGNEKAPTGPRPDQG